jgi:hypothetical protein
MKLMKDCLEALRLASYGSPLTPEAYIRKVIEGWFLEAPIHEIYYENFAQWACWAFFNKQYSDLTPEEVTRISCVK